MFFNLECTQDNGQHIPNLGVVQNESGDKFVFSGPQQQRRVLGVAYDGYFILQCLYKYGITPEVITRGAKILSLTVPELDIKFIDSFCFTPIRLANFPKTFGIAQLEKGFSPHFFNRVENQNYVEPYQKPCTMIPTV